MIIPEQLDEARRQMSSGLRLEFTQCWIRRKSLAVTKRLESLQPWAFRRDGRPDLTDAPLAGLASLASPAPVTGLA